MGPLSSCGKLCCPTGEADPSSTAGAHGWPASITGGTDEFLGATGFVITTSGPHGGFFEVTITK